MLKCDGGLFSLTVDSVGNLWYSITINSGGTTVTRKIYVSHYITKSHVSYHMLE